ncbi:Transposase [mine drainage metagenome]|uniref:Transposase n=1 Tax=mine drainage metagenome TaxID=410659 RepID=T1BPG0_9ZZZZ
MAQPERTVKLFFLPGYSPELNPDELLNHDVKSHLGRRRPHTQRELIHTLRSHLHRRPRQPHSVRRFFLEKHVRYAAD